MPTEMNTDLTTPSQGLYSPPNPLPEKRGFPTSVWITLAVVVIALLVIIALGIASRAAAERNLEKRTEAAAIPVVNVTHPSAAPLSPEISLPGNTQAYMDTPIYARTSGYLKHWYFDIGAHVRKGQLMATIETPELDQQLQVAEADLKSTEANLYLANTTAARYLNLLKTNSVSKQETDQATGDAAAKKAAVDSAMANVRRLQQLQSFEKVYAPFDGIVTVRNTDVGALIDAGSGSAPKELFHLAAIDKIRVYVPVPEAYAGDIKNGSKASLTLDQYPGRVFEGTIARNSNMIDPASRTLNVEVDVDNPKGLLLPGAYVFVHFKVPERIENLTIPSNTLLFRSEGLRVGVVRDGRVSLVPITITHDAGQIVEIASLNLKPTDDVILDPSDSLTEGQQVQISKQKPAGAQ
ncbi:MAG: efflux RND transporter periplasmic adaptor subunit [Edaphobacter sp.]